MVVMATVLPSNLASAQSQPPERGGASCDWQGAVAGYSDWAVSNGNCSFTSNTFRYYEWTIPPGSNGRICVQARGWKYDSTQKKNVVVWTGLGCGTSGGANVPWCKGAPNPCIGMTKVRAKVQPGFLGAAYNWR